MTLGALSQAWTTAEAALPLGWPVVGLTWDMESDGWIATAIDPEPGERVTGWGNFHYQALNNLAIKLREVRGPVTGG